MIWRVRVQDHRQGSIGCFLGAQHPLSPPLPFFSAPHTVLPWASNDWTKGGSTPFKRRRTACKSPSNTALCRRWV